METSPALSRWLLGPRSDPSVRLRMLTEVQGADARDPRVLAAQRSIGREGWAARVLQEQLPSGNWATPGTTGSQLYRPKYIATNWRMIVLADLGMTQRDRRIRAMLDLVTRRWGGPRGALGGSESETCITGNALRAFLRFGYTETVEVDRMVRWLLRAQKADGGWHCFPSARGTLDAWEGLAAFAFLPPSRRTPAVERSIERGAEFFLKRRLFREGTARYEPWWRIHYPQHYYYDLLVGLDTLTRLGYGADRRLDPALRWLSSKCDGAGRWRLDVAHPDLLPDGLYQPEPPYYPFVLESPGRPSRWATVSALAIRALVAAARASRSAT